MPNNGELPCDIDHMHVALRLSHFDGDEHSSVTSKHSQELS
jgi:hypothetical protein